MKSRFLSRGYEVLVNLLIGIFLLTNIVLFFITWNPVALISISLQAALAYLAYTKHGYLRIGLKIWGILFVISGVLAIVIPYIQDIIGDPNLLMFFWGAAKIGIGCLLLYIVSEEMYRDDTPQRNWIRDDFQDSDQG